MKILKQNLWCLLAFVSIMAVAQSDWQSNPMVRLTMNVYAEQIAANPQDYSAYYGRAKEYFRYGEMDLALVDLNEAIKYFPQQMASELSQAYTMRGLIYQEKGKLNNALVDLNKALQLDATSRFSLIARADLLFEMGDYEHAYEDYQSLLRRDVRCQEAYIGLARIALKEANMGLCNDYLKKLQETNPRSPEMYVARGAVYEEMKEWRKAADDYVSAMIYGDNHSAVAALSLLAKKTYYPVVEALTAAIELTDDKGFYLFLRGTIHMNHAQYTPSIKDWNEIIEQKYYHYQSIYANRANCYLHLGQFEYALADIQTAIDMKGDEVSYFIVRSKINRIMGFFDKAAEDLAIAATFDIANVEVLQQKGLLAAEQGNLEAALGFYNEAILYNADDAYSYLLRSVNYEKMGNLTAAANNCQMVISLPEEVPTFATLRGFAWARLGRAAEAEQWIEAVLREKGDMVGGIEYYQAACLYAQTGNKERAYHYLELAFKAGYADYYNIYFECDSPISLAPLRGESDFSSLVQAYSSIF